MSVHADLDLASPKKRRAAKLKTDLSALAGSARTRLEDARERGLEIAGASGARAKDYALTAAGHVRRKPVSTGLIVAAVGVGLVFLLSRSARSKAVAYGEDLWGRYGRR